MTWSALITAAAGVVGLGVGIWISRRRFTRDLYFAREQLSQRVADLFSVQERGFVMSESLEPSSIVGRAARYVHTVVGASGTAVVLIQDEGPHLYVAAAEGSFADLAGRALEETEAGPLLDAIGNEQLVIIHHSDGSPPAVLPDRPVTNGAIAPLHAHGETLGALVIATEDTRPVSVDHQRLLSAVGAHAALVLSNARFFELIREGKEQWETVFDAITDGIAVLDHHHGVRRANRALTDMLQHANLGGHLCEDFFDNGAELHSLIQRVAERGQRQSVVLRSTRLDRTLHVAAAPMRGTTLPENWTVVVIADITERRSLEAQLIQNERMVAVGQLASGVAHELNNPLTSIGGLAEFLMSRDTINRADREHLAVINEQAVRATRIVRNLLTFARSGPMEITDVNLSDVCRRAARLIEYELRLRKVELHKTLAPRLPRIRGDRHQLQQVIVNLLTNAIQAAEHGALERIPVVWIETGRDRGSVFVRVKDTGTGVSREAMRDIFTPFYTTKDPGEGTGLGLSISYGIAKGHGGTLAVEATGAEGTTFRLDLPIPERTRRPAAERRAARASDAGRTAPLPTLAVESVLLVDDDPAVRRTIAALFSGEGQRVDATPHAGRAIEKLRADSAAYDLIIADPRLATPDGQSFAEYLLQSWPALKSRTILITADGRPETTRWLEGLGCRFLAKPFNVRELFAAADQSLMQSPARGDRDDRPVGIGERD